MESMGIIKEERRGGKIEGREKIKKSKMDMKVGRQEG